MYNIPLALIDIGQIIKRLDYLIPHYTSINECAYWYHVDIKYLDGKTLSYKQNTSLEQK